jgi:hypothetical protein
MQGGEMEVWRRKLEVRSSDQVWLHFARQGNGLE